MFKLCKISFGSIYFKRSKSTSYRRRKEAALSVAALFSSSSENEEDHPQPLTLTNIEPVLNNDNNLENSLRTNVAQRFNEPNDYNETFTHESFDKYSSSSEIEDDSSSSLSDEVLESTIASWAIRHNITHSALNDLLLSLSKYPPFKYLPRLQNFIKNTKHYICKINHGWNLSSLWSSARNRTYG